MTILLQVYSVVKCVHTHTPKKAKEEKKSVSFTTLSWMLTDYYYYDYRLGFYDNRLIAFVVSEKNVLTLRGLCGMSGTSNSPSFEYILYKVNNKMGVRKVVSCES